MKTGMKVGYLGPPGTFSEEAANKYLAWLAARTLVPGSESGPNQVKTAYPTLFDLFEAMERAEVALAVVPGENSLEGSVVLTWDLLSESSELTITGEFVLPVRHHLLAPVGTNLAEIREVLSHPQALGQCRRFLRTHLPDARTISTSSTAEAAALVAGGGRQEGLGSRGKAPGTAAIGTEAAAFIYGLNVIAKDIQDTVENSTRFLVLGRAGSAARELSNDGDVSDDPVKTSVIFSTLNHPGSLYVVLREFAERNLNLTRIESRPARRTLGEYLFFVDVEGGINEPRIAEAIAAIRRRTSFLRVLGSYPVHTVVR